MQIGVDCNLAVGNWRIFVLDTDEIGRMAVQFMLHDEYETHEIVTEASLIQRGMSLFCSKKLPSGSITM